MIDEVDGEVKGEILRLAHSNTIIKKRRDELNGNLIAYCLAWDITYYLSYEAEFL